MPEPVTDNTPSCPAAAILASLRDPLLVLDAGLRVTAAQRSFYETFQATPEQTLGRHLSELGNGQWNIPELRTRLEALFTANTPLDEYPIAHDFPTIGRRTMLLHARQLHDDGKPPRILLVMKDITPRRQAEQRMEASEIRYRRLFEAAHDGILILNSSSRRITDVNPFMLELLDFPRDHFVGKELWEIGIFKDKAAHQQAMQTLQDNGSIRFEDLPLQDRNGHRHPVEIVANIYQEGRASVIQCNIRDIGERVRFERERETLLANEQAARLEAEAANRSKDLFLATLSHEVRTPLSAILGWAGVLRSGKATEADLREGLEVIERNCKAQAQLIEDVMDVSRIVSGKMELHIAPCDLAEIIQAAVDVVRPAADARGVRLEMALDADAGRASGDANRLQQVLWNLLSNAIKFSPRGSQVRIALTRQHATAQIEIIDEGQGIDPAFLPFVFDRFRQAESSTRRKHGGLGLGLSIVKHLVELHGGTVGAASAGAGRGATLTVHLPIAARIAGAAGAAPRPSNGHATPDLVPIRLDGLRLLVVDDDADARRLQGMLLTDAGGMVTTAGSVAEALQAVVTSCPDVLVSDIAMPDQDGYDLIRQVRAAGHSARELPAVAVTAFAHKDDRLRTLRAGFQVHLPKPIDARELLAVIASLSGRTS